MPAACDTLLGALGAAWHCDHLLVERVERGEQQAASVGGKEPERLDDRRPRRVGEHREARERCIGEGRDRELGVEVADRRCSLRQPADAAEIRSKPGPRDRGPLENAARETFHGRGRRDAEDEDGLLGIRSHRGRDRLIEPIPAELQKREIPEVVGAGAMLETRGALRGVPHEAADRTEPIRVAPFDAPRVVSPDECEFPGCLEPDLLRRGHRGRDYRPTAPQARRRARSQRGRGRLRGADSLARRLERPPSLRARVVEQRSNQSRMKLANLKTPSRSTIEPVRSSCSAPWSSRRTRTSRSCAL